MLFYAQFPSLINFQSLTIPQFIDTKKSFLFDLSNSHHYLLIDGILAINAGEFSKFRLKFLKKTTTDKYLEWSSLNIIFVE